MENKRKHERIAKKIKCEVHSVTMTFSSTVDVSNGGLFISTPEPLREGSEIMVYLYIKDREPIPLKATVKWVRNEENDNLKSGMGVEFIDKSMKNLDLMKMLEE
jgi:uncharacterized protein (TIGR02266 family)